MIRISLGTGQRTASEDVGPKNGPVERTQPKHFGHGSIYVAFSEQVE